MKNIPRHLIAVITFTLTASLLIVFTTYSVHMLTALGKLDALFTQWEEIHTEYVSETLHYVENNTMEDSYQLSYLEQKLEANSLLISEIISGRPDPEVFVNNLALDSIHPNEVGGFIVIFSYFDFNETVINAKQSWEETLSLSNQSKALLNPLVHSEREELSITPVELEQIETLTADIHSGVRELILHNSNLLVLVRHCSMWLTVLSGLVVLIIGVIYISRVMIQRARTYALLKERDYLAKFPELNKFPVLNVNVDGSVEFLNKATTDIFPDLKERGISHPFFDKLRPLMPKLIRDGENSVFLEVEVDGKFYQQAIHFLSEEQGFHMHNIDITELKNEQFQLSRTVEEKDTLLMEIHHRVKNNMAVISGLLELQNMIGTNKETALQDSLHRIKSMAVVHELLYQSDSFSNIEVDGFLKNMGAHLQSRYGYIQSVSVSESNTDFVFNINHAIPLGLLINEYCLLAEGNTGTKIHSADITLALTSQNGELHFSMDSGSDELKNVFRNIDSENGLSSNLIHSLLAQIKGKTITNSSNGQVLGIRFKPDSNKGSSSTL
ncbi:MAG: hypothetical protein MI700_02370 [Balneolales bacterium]|nr:hypothetical protein [Balneolales bacterium]